MNLPSFQHTKTQPHDAGAASQDWLLPEGVGSIGNVTPNTAARAYGWLFLADVPKVIDRVRLYLVTLQTGAEARAGIYRNNAGRPSTLMADLSTVDLSADSGTDKDFTVSDLRVEGPFWVIVWLKNVVTQATLKGVSGATPFHRVGQPSTILSAGAGGINRYVASAYPASMPSTAPTFDSWGGSGPMPAVRVK